MYQKDEDSIIDCNRNAVVVWGKRTANNYLHKLQIIYNEYYLFKYNDSSSHYKINLAHHSKKKELKWGQPLAVSFNWLCITHKTSNDPFKYHFDWRSDNDSFGWLVVFIIASRRNIPLPFRHLDI